MMTTPRKMRNSLTIPMTFKSSRLKMKTRNFRRRGGWLRETAKKAYHYARNALTRVKERYTTNPTRRAKSPAKRSLRAKLRTTLKNVAAKIVNLGYIDRKNNFNQVDSDDLKWDDRTGNYVVIDESGFAIPLSRLTYQFTSGKNNSNERPSEKFELYNNYSSDESLTNHKKQLNDLWQKIVKDRERDDARPPIILHRSPIKPPSVPPPWYETIKIKRRLSPNEHIMSVPAEEEFFDALGEDEVPDV